MTLANLLKTGQLKEHQPDAREIQRLLDSAQRNLKDSAVANISAETRFDAAYKAIMQCAMIALRANGYRTLTSRPGHHQTALQTLPLTIALANERMIVLDALRKQRNLADYEGDPVTAQTVVDCLAQARQLLADVKAWLAANKPELS